MYFLKVAELLGLYEAAVLPKRAIQVCISETLHLNFTWCKMDSGLLKLFKAIKGRKKMLFEGLQILNKSSRFIISFNLLFQNTVVPFVQQFKFYTLLVHLCTGTILPFPFMLDVNRVLLLLGCIEELKCITVMSIGKTYYIFLTNCCIFNFKKLTCL